MGLPDGLSVVRAGVGRGGGHGGGPLIVTTNHGEEGARVSRSHRTAHRSEGVRDLQAVRFDEGAEAWCEVMTSATLTSHVLTEPPPSVLGGDCRRSRPVPVTPSSASRPFRLPTSVKAPPASPFRPRHPRRRRSDRPVRDQQEALRAAEHGHPKGHRHHEHP
ncbi:hypothetical protein ACFFX0_08385 [Citricoccus parietis]|uniref:Uncharacterized protein n=1 Tax=Citricoccus parietis TaxID=592307 RepID=A0ABV5FX20_9MICC